MSPVLQAFPIAGSKPGEAVRSFLGSCAFMGKASTRQLARRFHVQWPETAILQALRHQHAEGDFGVLRSYMCMLITASQRLIRHQWRMEPSSSMPGSQIDLHQRYLL